MKKKLFKFFAAFVAACSICTIAVGCKNDGIELKILKEEDDSMINTYAMIAVDPNAPFISSTDGSALAAGSVSINTAGADAFIEWMSSSAGRNLIKDYGKADYDEYLFYLLDTAETYSGTIAAATSATKTIRLSTTTSVNDSGLLSAIVPTFEKDYGYEVKISSAGTGKAIAAATYGNADLILVHSKSQEETFINAHYARKVASFKQERLAFMYNYFVLVGPKKDPAKVADAANVKEAFKKISDGSYTFISRGDKSGTHTKEISLWDSTLKITTEATSVKNYPWYVSANAGMGVCLTQANEKGAYILSDKATFLTFKANRGIMLQA